MSRLFAILILFSGPFETVQAQLFDTLLSQFTIIEEIYPLKDSTFVLIGRSNSEILVERINQKAEVIWSLPVVSYARDYLSDFRYDITSEDSIIQIATAHKDCDYYSSSPYKVFTIDLSGKLLDSQSVSFGNENRLIYLLSGLPNRPRLAYIVDKKVILKEANGDTSQLQLAWSSGDTSNSFLLGLPKTVTMYPNGDILVGSNSSFCFRFRKENNRYVVVDERYGFDFQSLICLEDPYIIFVSNQRLELRGDQGLQIFFNPEGRIWRNLIWRDPYLVVRVYGFDSPDTMFFLNSRLDIMHKEPIDYGNISAIAIQDSITYKVGSGNIYFDHGLLLGEHLITHKGPKYYDVELIDFQLGPYDGVHWEYGYGNYYQYDIPHATVTVKNNSDYTIDNIVIHYARTVTYCSDIFWERELTAMNLVPGETQTFDLYDIFIGIGYPEEPFENVCIYAIQPDHHFDDYFDDNELCKKVELLPSANVDMAFPIHHTPSVIQNFITFVSPLEIDFKLTIYSSHGVPVFTGINNTYSGISLDLSFLPAGLYIFQYDIPDQKKRYVEKILKY